MRAFVRVTVIGGLLCGLLVLGCKKQEAAPAEAAPAETAPAKQASNVPPSDEHNIVNLALASKDHTTLVAALKAADYVAAVGNTGPITVFAPTNDAFAKLPEGTVENLVKPENVDTLRQILKYHVIQSGLKPEWLKDGQLISMQATKKDSRGISVPVRATVHLKDGKLSSINDANIIARIEASNGVLYIIDTVLLPPEK